MLSIPELSYSEARSKIRSGDILLASGNFMFSKLIKFATRSEWSHVAFILKNVKVGEEHRFFVYESVETKGVRMFPLSGYAYDYEGAQKGYNGRLLIARHDDIDSEKIDHMHSKAVNKAISMIGYPYDNIEIAKIAGRLIARRFGIGSRGEQKDNGEDICAEYGDRFLKVWDISINRKDESFITPDDFYTDPKIKPICFIIPQTVKESPYN